MSECFQIILCLQEKSTNIGLEVSSRYARNCFRHYLIYILGQKSSKKSDKKNFELYQIFVAKYFNAFILYMLKALLSKNRLYFFFLIF